MAIDTTNGLLNLTQVKNYMGDTGTDQDTVYSDAVDSVSSLFNSYTGRELRSREQTEYYDGDGTDELMLDNWPIVSAASEIDLRIDSDREYSTGDKVSSSSIILYSTEGRIILDDDSFDRGRQSVKIVYTAGFTVSSTSDGSTSGTIPADLRRAALEMVDYEVKTRERHQMHISSITSDEGSVTYENGIPFSVKKVLDSYRRYDLG